MDNWNGHNAPWLPGPLPTLPDMLQAIALGVLLLAGLEPIRATANPGDMTIERPALGSTIRLQTSARFAGAVSSIIFRGKQYVDTRDHGRELQSASSFDDLGECFNPTEAGGFADLDALTTSSKLVGAKSGPDWIKTSTDMAFWLPPDFDYKKQCGHTPTVTHSVNKTVRGDHILDKRIELGKDGMPNIIADHMTFRVPEAHRSATFEAATLYTPVDFSARYVLNPDSGALERTTVFGEQPLPVILATVDGNNAVGLYSRALPQAGRGYGSFSFPNTEKINCVFREKTIAAGQKFSYECDFVVGTLQEVRASILKLYHGAATTEAK